MFCLCVSNIGRATMEAVSRDNRAISGAGRCLSRWRRPAQSRRRQFTLTAKSTVKHEENRLQRFVCATNSRKLLVHTPSLCRFLWRFCSALLKTAGWFSFHCRVPLWWLTLLTVIKISLPAATVSLKCPTVHYNDECTLKEHILTHSYYPHKHEGSFSPGWDSVQTFAETEHQSHLHHKMDEAN